MLGDKTVPNERVGKVGTIYNMDLQTQTRKQVQMHITAKIIADKLVTKVKVKCFQGIFRTMHLISQHWITSQ